MTVWTSKTFLIILSSVFSLIEDKDDMADGSNVQLQKILMEVVINKHSLYCLLKGREPTSHIPLLSLKSYVLLIVSKGS